MLDIYAAHEQKQIARISDELAAGQMFFSVLVLAVFDYFLAGWFGIHGTTVLQALALLGQPGEYVLAIGFILAVAATLKLAWFPEDLSNWIYYPPLYEEIEKERRRMREIEDRLRF